jgi:hypothetical protein
LRERDDHAPPLDGTERAAFGADEEKLGLARQRERCLGVLDDRAGESDLALNASSQAWRYERAANTTR